MTNPLITVVVPIYNIIDFLEDCITSIVSQTYINLEIILVDDGSTDGSEIVCDKWKEIDKRIVVIHKKNEGLSSARNIGIVKAKGKYISFIDGDDIVHCEFIDVMYKELQRANVKIAVCGMEYCYDREKEFLDDLTSPKVEILSGSDMWERFIRGDRIYDLNVTCNKLYDIGLFDDIKFPVGRLHEDNATIYKILYKSVSLVIIYKKMYKYIQRKGSIINRTISMKRCEDIIISSKERIDFFKNYINEFFYPLIVFEMWSVLSVITSAPKNERLLLSEYGTSIYKISKKNLSFIWRCFFGLVFCCPCIYVIYSKIFIKKPKVE